MPYFFFLKMEKQKRLTDYGYKKPVTNHYDFMVDFRLSEIKEINKYL